MAQGTWLTIGKPLSGDRKRVLLILSFLLPLLLWVAVSYVPFIWHPLVRITNPGDVSYFTEGTEVDKDDFNKANQDLVLSGGVLAEGYPVNPVYLPAPHEVATAFYEAFVTPPRRAGEPWLHESLLHSISVIFWAFALSSLIGVPLGILAGSTGFFRGLIEPFVEFFRYLPAPAFGALAVAVLGINDGPKIAIIFIGTFFQQILVISATTQKVRPTIIEAAQTLGAKKMQLLTKVIVPAILPDMYRDQRILLGWAWTYLIVAEVVGTSTGITWFIYQQAKYRVFDNVYAAIIMIGIIGLVSDMLLAALGKKLFPWVKDKKSS
jgi:NitT/TauT family transport system permease protein